MSYTTRVEETEHEPADPLPFDRRLRDRWPADGVAKVFHVAGERFGEVHTLKLIDQSHECLGARCAWPIEPGTIVSIGFTAPGAAPRRGVVVRCAPCGDGYRLAIRYELRQAA